MRLLDPQLEIDINNIAVCLAVAVTVTGLMLDVGRRSSFSLVLCRHGFYTVSS